MNQSSCIAPHHPHCPHYCNTIARLLRNIRIPTDPTSVCIHHNILVMAISCKGQGTTGRASFDEDGAAPASPAPQHSCGQVKGALCA